ncbi:hypothetical protein BGW41_006582, partial [Actinomortierella wolfii]
MDLMNFLDYGLEEKKWRLTTIQAYKSAILQLFTVEHRQTITSNELFQEFMKVMGKGTIKRVRDEGMDLSPILTHLRGMGDNYALDIKNLTIKTCFLLSMTGLLRSDDLACVDASQCTVVDGELKLRILYPKEHRQGQRLEKSVRVKAHPMECLCPVKAFVEYRRRTAEHDRFARTTHPKMETV